MAKDFWRQTSLPFLSSIKAVGAASGLASFCFLILGASFLALGSASDASVRIWAQYGKGKEEPSALRLKDWVLLGEELEPLTWTVMSTSGLSGAGDVGHSFEDELAAVPSYTRRWAQTRHLQPSLVNAGVSGVIVDWRWPEDFIYGDGRAVLFVFLSSGLLLPTV
jgi:hypothetical protein